MSYLPVCIWAVDSSVSLMAFTKPLTVVLFVINILQLEEKHRDNLINVIPLSIFALTAIGFACTFYEKTAGVAIDSNNNFFPFFQYANVYAFAVLSALVILITRKKYNLVVKLVFSVTFLLAIYFTHSRAVYLLTIVFFMAYFYKTIAMKNKKSHLWIILCCIVFILASIVVLQIKYDLFSNLLKESSFNSRLFYYKDSLKMIITHPFGSGVNGFYYMQPKYQSANYYSMYVHNDYLNIACDVGIIPALLMVFLLGYSIIKEKNLTKKSLLILLGLHMFVDFDLQYMYIYLILSLCLNVGDIKNIKIKSSGLIAFVGVVLTIYCSFFAYISMLMYNENYKKVTYYYNHTTALLMQMTSTTNSNEAYKLANELLDNNKYIFEAHHTLANIYIANDKPIDAMNEMEKVLEYDHMNSKEYDDYILICYKAGRQLKKQGDLEHSQIAFDKAIRVTDDIKKLNSSLSKRAFYLRKKPQIILSKKSDKLILRMKESLYGGE